MPAKKDKGPSKKTVEKAKMKIVEDKTFGLKNKNKSAKVQKYVASVQTQVMHGNKKKSELSQADEKKKRKEEEAKRLAELKALFKVAPPKKSEKKDEEEDEEGQFKSAADAEEYLWNADDFEAVEQDETRLEETLQKEMEELREKQAADKSGIPVTEETFQAWKRKQRENAKKEEAKQKKKMAKTGTWTGRALFEHDQTLFVDDDDASEEYEREEEERPENPDGEQEGEVSVKKWEDPAEGAIDDDLFDGEDLDIEDLEDEEN